MIPEPASTGCARFAGAVWLLIAASACSAPEPTARHTGAIVNGADDRQEYFEVDEPLFQDRMAQSMVGLIPSVFVEQSEAGLAVNASSLGETDGLCPGEPFAEQPAAAFCGGVLVDYDLVLTAGHCVRLLALSDFLVVFGYYYSSPGTLALSEARQPLAIVSEALDPAGSDPRLDFAWIELDRGVSAPRQPVPIRAAAEALAPDHPIVAVSDPGGIPLKFDAGARVRDARAAASDYFLADTDTSHGSSGGAAFDRDGTLVGVLARGGVDSFTTLEGCQRGIVQADGAATEEQFTYASRALAALCRDAPDRSICRSDCGEPCLALPPPPAAAEQGCSLARPSSRKAPGALIALALSLLRLASRLRRRGASGCGIRVSPGSLLSSSPAYARRHFSGIRVRRRAVHGDQGRRS